MQQRGPQFLILEDRSYRSFGAALAALWETESPAQSIGLYHSRAWPHDHRPVPGMFTSILLHFAVIVLLVRLPFAALFPIRTKTPEVRHMDEIVYVLHGEDLDYLPLVNPGGVGGQPGQGSHPEQPPVLGSTAFHPYLTIVSNPPQPDNSRQTIIQTSSPPRLTIPKDLRLPNVLIGGATAPPPQAEVEPEPPRKAGGNSAETSASKSASTPVAPELALAPPPEPVPNPALPVSEPVPPVASPATKAEIADLGVSSRAGAGGLLSLSVDPAPATESVSVPPGNRFGAFSISPAGGKEGSPGGVANGDARGGSGGSGSAGDASTGVGSGGQGGGGAGSGGATVAEGVSISRSGGENGVLPSFFASTLVYPVSPPPPRRPALVVSAGPAGGGGLHLYGILKGGKIYTIYLPMPGKSWVLQYCAHESSNAAGRPLPRSKGVEIQLAPALVPPSAVEEYDFHRPPLSKPTVGGKDMIILQGVIREDGTVGELQVRQGILDLVDQAAMAAFGRWKFSAALREGKPVAVDVLVGIPILSSST